MRKLPYRLGGARSEGVDEPDLLARCSFSLLPEVPKMRSRARRYSSSRCCSVFLSACPCDSAALLAASSASLSRSRLRIRGGGAPATLGKAAPPAAPGEEEEEKGEEEDARLGARTDCGRTLVELSTGCTAGLD